MIPLFLPLCVLEIGELLVVGVSLDNSVEMVLEFVLLG